MNLSLSHHPQGYQLTFKDVIWAAIGFTGAPYAQRHLEQSRQETPWTASRMAHRAIFLVESMPILGSCAALAEGLFHACFKSSSPIEAPPTPRDAATRDDATEAPPTPRDTATIGTQTEMETTSGFPREKPLEPEAALEKMVTNLVKSFNEHIQGEIEKQAFDQLHNRLEELFGRLAKGETEEQAFERVYKTANEIVQRFVKEHESIPLKNTPYFQSSEIPPPTRDSRHLLLPNPQFYEMQGPRTSMEDAHFHLKIDTEKTQGTLVGVYDGHGGQEVAQFASKEFKKLFLKELERTNAFQAFEEVIDKIQQEIMTHPEWENMGSTAVICYIDKKTRRVYTATLGDCEANIYRNIKGTMKSIPLSPVRDWTSKHDFDRLKKFFRGVKAVDAHIEECKQRKIFAKLEGKDYSVPKNVRSYLYDGANTSRAFGDANYRGTKKRPLIIHKPKITVFTLQEKDILTLACDGLKDYLSERDIISIIRSKKTTKDMSTGLVNAAIQNMNELNIGVVNPADLVGDNVTVCAIKVGLSDT